MSKEYCNGRTLSEKVLNGANVLADNVVSTLGPKGRNVILYDGNKPVITKDGVTVANFIELSDPFENLGVQVLKQASQQTAAQAGDGTTTSIVLARAMLREAQKYVSAGVSPIDLKRGMDAAAEDIVASLDDIAVPISSEQEIEDIATISANNDRSIGKLIATAVDKAGKDGAITIEEARSMETSLDIVEGFRFDSGYLAAAFVNDERRGVVKYEDPYVLVTDHKLETVNEMLPVLEVVAREGRPLVIVADDIEGQALAALIMNCMRGSMKVVGVKAPRYGEERRGILKDLAISVGATYVSSTTMKLSDVKLKDFGRCKTIEVSKNLTTIVGGKGSYEEIDTRIESLKSEMASTDSMYDAQRIQERITRLASGIAIIRVGAATEVEMIEKKHRIEDALEAVKSAQQEGILPGGGVALLRLAELLKRNGMRADDLSEAEKMGYQIVERACHEPIRQMALNAGLSPDLIIQKVELAGEEEWFNGYNFRTDQIMHMVKNGVIDPAKVTRCAVQNSVSAAGTLITTNYAVVKV
jgi:chaperonin GroEL